MTVIVHGGDAIYGGISFDGPATTTNNAIAAWDGTTGDALKNSGFVLTGASLTGLSTSAAMAWAHSGGAFSITSTSQNLSIVTATSGTLAITSAGALNLSSTTGDWQGTGALTIDSSGGAISIGGDADAQAINVGTGAAARTITIGNTTGATGLVLNYGSGNITTPDTLVIGSVAANSHGSPGGSAVILGNGARGGGLASVSIGLSTDVAGTASIGIGRNATCASTPSWAFGYDAVGANANQASFFSTTQHCNDFNITMGANAQALHIQTLTESTTLEADASTDTAIQVPAGALVLYVSARVTTAVTTSSATNTFSYGPAAVDANRWGNNIAGALNTTNRGTDEDGSPKFYTSAVSIRITAPGAETFTAGVIRFTIHYIQVTVPTG